MKQISTNLLAGAPIEDHTSVTNPILNENLQDALLNRRPSEFLRIFIPNLVGIAYVIGFVIFVFILILGGIQVMTAGGDKASLESAKGRLTNAIIGLVILLSTFAVIKIIEAFFGINILTIDFAGLVV